MFCPQTRKDSKKKFAHVGTEKSNISELGRGRQNEFTEIKTDWINGHILICVKKTRNKSVTKKAEEAIEAMMDG